MAIYISNHDSVPISAAARLWVQRCLVEDGSLFGEESLWTLPNIEALHTYFVLRPETGSGGFYEKLKAQVADAPPSARRLMAEILWAVFLFPSNINKDTKRDAVINVWSWSGAALNSDHSELADSVLDGIGSGGPAINNHRWRELAYVISMTRTIKALPAAQRAACFDEYDRFVRWMDQVPQEGERLFRHMLRYLLFPQRVERMSTNRDRINVLAGYKIATRRDLRKWSDQQLDAALLALRGRLEKEFETQSLDFYDPPLSEQWRVEAEPESLRPTESTTGATALAEPREDYIALPVKPRNLILYGPPGTGKTFRLQSMFEHYTDQAADVDRNTWALELVGRFGWRAVIVSALADLGRPVRVAELEAHPLIRSKMLERELSKSVRAMLWSYLQEHTPLEVTTVHNAIRRPPFVFTKNENSEWSPLPDWRDLDGDATDLADAWNAGPSGYKKPVLRYRVVTFHPSYSYEDFVIGLRPMAVPQGEERSTTEFRMVDGVFKQICAQARSNPSKRYALFIDEINRANIAKVFGELITLIEGDKRARYDAAGVLIGGIEVQLPGTGSDESSEHRFGVPANLDIFGTMNTADRSIALLDVALRRRFEFEELAPEYGKLDRRVDGVDLGKLLRVINERLEFLANRDRQIGHAYFIKINSLEDLRNCFRLQVIPLLQEYFFDDWRRVQQVLSGADGGSAFLAREVMDGARLFGAHEEELRLPRDRFRVTDAKAWSPEMFRAIYEGRLTAAPAELE